MTILTPAIRTAPVDVRHTLLATAANLRSIRMSGSGLTVEGGTPGRAAHAPASGPPPANPTPSPQLAPISAGKPHSPGFGPGDPADIAEACAAAGFTDLASQFIRSGAAMASVKDRLAEAKEIQLVANAVGLPKMARSVVKMGLSLVDARVHLFEAKANKDADVRTDTTPPSDRNKGQANTGPIDADAVYSKFNAPK